jgi:hypothetical protein
MIQTDFEGAAMLRSIEGIYRAGQVTLLEPVPPACEGKVIVTFLQPYDMEPAGGDMTKAQAADLKLRLRAFHDDWDSPAGPHR